MSLAVEARSDLSPPTAGAATDAVMQPPYPASREAWFAVGALAFANMMSYVERQIPTLMFAPIKRDFHLSDTQVSLLAGIAFVLFYVGCGLFIGRLADRANRKWIISIGIVVWSMATISCGLAQSFARLFVGRMMVGVGEATLGPSATSLLSDYFPRDRLAGALSVYTGAQYLGAGLALVVGGFAIQMVDALPPLHLPGIGALHPWQTTFLVVGTIGMAVIVPVLFLREPLRRGQYQAGHAAPQTIQFIRQNWKTLGAIYAAFSISSAAGFGTAAWIPTYFVRVHHWPVHDIGYVYGLMLALLGGAGVLTGARFAQWLAKRGYEDAYLRAPLISLSVAGVPAALATLMPTANAALLILVFSTFLSSFPVAVVIAGLQIITPNQMRAQIVALYFFLANIFGVGLGPTIVAAITDHVYRSEAAVGYSLATTIAITTPLAALLVWLGLGHYRESLARAAAWTVVSERHGTA